MDSKQEPSGKLEGGSASVALYIFIGAMVLCVAILLYTFLR